MNIKDFGLITDRTAEDVKHVQELAQKIAEGIATNEELVEYLTNLKGAYNISDLNRVGRAVKYIQERLHEIGITINVTAKSDWTEDDYNDAAAMEYYLKDIKAVHTALGSGERLPLSPDDINVLTYDDANAIEKILLAQNQSIDLMTQITIPSNIYNSAAVGYLLREPIGDELIASNGLVLLDSIAVPLCARKEG